jgi:hypothetical protein
MTAPDLSGVKSARAEAARATKLTDNFIIFFLWCFRGNHCGPLTNSIGKAAQSRYRTSSRSWVVNEGNALWELVFGGVGTAGYKCVSLNMTAVGKLLHAFREALVKAEFSYKGAKAQSEGKRDNQS